MSNTKYAYHGNYLDLSTTNYSKSDVPGVLGRLKGMCSQVCTSKNGFEYTRELIESIINDPRIQEQIDNKVLFGELSHPPRETEYLTEVQMNNVSHNIISLELVDDKIIVELDILDTPSGRIADTLIRYGSKLGISSRGVQISDLNTNVMTPDNYYLITWDLVAVPGVAGARLHPVTEFMSPESAKSLISESVCNLKSSINRVLESKDGTALKVYRSIVESADAPIREELEDMINKSELIDSSQLDNIVNDLHSKQLEKVDSNVTDVPDDNVIDDSTKDLNGSISTLESTDVPDVDGPINGIYLSVPNSDKFKKVFSTLESSEIGDDGIVTINIEDDQIDDLINLLTPTTVVVDDIDNTTDNAMTTDPVEDVSDVLVVEPSSTASIFDEMKTTLDEIQSMLGTNSELLEENTKLKERVESLSSTNKTLRNRIKVMKESYIRLETDKNNAIKKLVTENSSLLQSNRELQVRNSKTVKESESRASALNTLRLQSSGLELQLESYKKRYESAQSELDKLEGRSAVSAVESRRTKFDALANNYKKITSSNLYSDSYDTQSESVQETTKVVKGVLSRTVVNKQK